MVNQTASTKHEVLKILRQTDTEISGSQLAELCAVTRVSVWKAIQALNTSGYKIATSKTGYRLVKDVEDSLYPWEFSSNEDAFTHFEQTDSTMTQARKIASALMQSEDREFKIVTADSQSQGRGRGEHKWTTTKGSLAFTVVTFPALLHHQSYCMVLAAQIAIIKVLEKNCDRKFFTRWPNDIWSEAGKVAGILDEVSSAGGKISWCNLGIGINLTNKPRMEKTDCAFNSKEEIPRKKILQDFLDELNITVKTAEDNPAQLVQIWNSYCMDLNSKILVQNKTCVFEGTDELGRAIIKNNKGEQRFFPGEIHYEK